MQYLDIPIHGLSDIWMNLVSGLPNCTLSGQSASGRASLKTLMGLTLQHCMIHNMCKGIYAGAKP